MADNTFNIKSDISVKGEQQLKGAAAAMQQMGAQTQQTAAKLGKAKGEFQSVAGAFVSLFVANKLTQALKGVALAADEIAIGMSAITAVAGDTGQVAEKLKSKMLDVANSVGISFGEVAIATRNLIAQNLDPNSIGAFLEPLLQFQKVGELSQQQTSDLVVAMQTMGVESQNVAAGLDLTLKLANESALATRDFADVLTRAGPAARVANQSFAELARSAAILRRGFQTGAIEGTSFNTLLNKLLDPKRQQFLRETFNVEVVDEFNGGLRGLNDIFFELSEASQRTQGSIGLLLQEFGPRAGGRVLATALQAFQEGVDVTVDGVTKRLKGAELLEGVRQMDAAGAVTKAFDASMQNLTAQVNVFLTTAKTLLGEALMPMAAAMTTLVSVAASFAVGLRELFTEMPALATVVSTIATLVFSFTAFRAAQLAIAGSGRILRVAMAFMSGELATNTAATSLNVTSKLQQIVANNSLTASLTRLSAAHARNTLNAQADAALSGHPLGLPGQLATVGTAARGGLSLGALTSSFAATAALIAGPIVLALLGLQAVVSDNFVERVEKRLEAKRAKEAQEALEEKSKFQSATIATKEAADALARATADLRASFQKEEPAFNVGKILEQLAKAPEIMARAAAAIGKDPQTARDAAAIQVGELRPLIAQLVQGGTLDPKQTENLFSAFRNLAAGGARARKVGVADGTSFSDTFVDAIEAGNLTIEKENVVATRRRLPLDERGNLSGRFSDQREGDVIGHHAARLGAQPGAQSGLTPIQQRNVIFEAVESALKGGAGLDKAQRVGIANAAIERTVIKHAEIHGAFRLNIDGEELVGAIDAANARSHGRELGADDGQ
jgi:TP901 family phage tail tape measure protein